MIRDPQQVPNISYVPGDLGQKIRTARAAAVVPPLEFVEKEKGQRRAGKLVDLDYVVRVDVWKVHNPWNEDVDLEPLKLGFGAIGAPIQDLVPMSRVPRPDGVKSIVFCAELSLDGLCAARVSGEAKDIEVLVSTTSEYAGVYAFRHNDTPLAGDLCRVCRVYTPSPR